MSMSFSEVDLENLKRWAEGRPLLGAPRNIPQPVPTGANMEVVAHPFYHRVSPKSSSGVDRWKNPDTHPDCAATDKFNDYVRQVTTFPGFFLEKNENTEEHRTSENYDLMIKDIVDAYRGYGTGDVNLIAEQVENSAKSILNKSSTSSKRAIFSQDTITEINGMHYITVFYCTLEMYYKQDGKKTLIDQTYHINRSLIRINTSYLIAYAEKLEALVGDGGLSEWGRSLSSPTGTRNACRAEQTAAVVKELVTAQQDIKTAPREI
ncbi:hypothetical protein BGW41_003474 [Actinomortierella wolfii]|nr:hypothetical protein BGW41_003474 [Actinomortierella wolfii]